MSGIKCILIFLFVREALSDLITDPELNSDYYQGDILSRPKRARNGIGSEIYHWPNATVYYVVEPNVFDVAQLQQISNAMTNIENNSCVVFQKATEKELPFALTILGSGQGCNTQTLGFRNTSHEINLQRFKVGEGCFRIGSIIHELLHVLGFEHQHVAQDRDQYVRIVWENIAKEYFVNFLNEDNTTNWHAFGEAYDYDSVMHYLPSAFSTNGSDTIVALKEGANRMGQRVEMSKTDIRKLNKMYKCPGYI